MNTEITKSKIHFNIPSLIGLISQTVLTCLWFTEIIDYDLGLFSRSFSAEELLDRVDILPAYYINIVFLVIAIIPWINAVLKTSRRGFLYVSIAVSYAQAAIVAGFRFLYASLCNIENLFTLNKFGIATVVFSAVCIVLAHISYSVIKKYQKSIKESKQ